MSTKMEKFPAKNPNPVLSVEKDGTIIYSNKAGEPLLHEWGVRLGDKLPSCIEDLVQRVIARNSTEKLEVKARNRVYLLAFHPIQNEKCVNIYGFDISDQKELEEKLKESEKKLSEAQKMAHIGNWDWNLITGEMYWSDEMYRIFGRTSKKFSSFSEVLTFTHPNDREHVDNAVKKAIKGEPFGIDHRIISGNGEERIVHAQGEVVFDEKNNPFRMRGTVQDITERKKVEDMLRQSEERLLLAQQVAKIGTFEWNIQTGVNIWTTELEATYGLRSGEFGKTQSAWEQLVHPDDRQKAVSIVEHAFQTADPVEGEWRVTWPDDSVHWITGRFQVFRDKAGQPKRLTGVNIDITERKLAEEALHKANERLQAQSEELQVQNEELQSQSEELKKTYNELAESEEHFHTMANAIPQLAWIARADGYIYWYNDRWYDYTGTTPEQIEGWGWQSVHDPTVLPKVLKKWRSSIATGQMFDMEFPLRGADGVFRPFLTRVLPLKDAKGQVIQWFGTNTDITERKNAEEVLRKSKAELSKAQEISKIGSWTWDLITNEVTWSEQSYRNYGLSKDAVKPSYELFLSSILPEDRERVDSEVRKAIESGHKYSVTYRITRIDGTSRILLSENEIVTDESGKVVLLYGTNQDITERKKAEEALRKSEERYRILFTNMTEGFGLVEVICNGNDKPYDFRYLEINPVFELYFGVKRETVLGKTILEAFPNASPIAIEKYEEVAISGQPTNFEIFSQVANKSIEIYVFSPEKGKLALILRDITERKEAEAKVKDTLDNLDNLVKERTQKLEKAYNSLKESEKGLAEAQKMAHIGNWEWEIATDKAYWSDEMHRIFGRDPQKLAPTYKEYLNYIHPDDRIQAEIIHREAVSGKPFNMDRRIVLDNGEVRLIHMQTEIIFDDNNIPIKLKGTIQDITERKKAEEKIKVLAKAIETSNDAILTVSLDGIVTSWNKGAEQIYGYTAEEILGQSASILEPDYLKGEVKQFNEKVKRGEKIKNYETMRLRKDGTPINVSITLSPVFDDSGRMIAFSVIIRDITERIRTEKLLAKAEEARKKEIHHRIKNNLQVISSLLDLQADKFNDSKVIEAFRESQNRVISMALIHEELYKEKGTDTLDFSEYLKTLAENLFQTYRLSSKDIHVYTDLEKNTLFDIDTAIPLGMVVNELVSNSFKYAFQGRDKGEIRINLHREEGSNTNYVLSVSDDGIGIPEDLDIENLDSLGMQLITSLVDQLDGELELKKDNGTEFIIRFIVEEKGSGISSTHRNS